MLKFALLATALFVSSVATAGDLDYKALTDSSTRLGMSWVSMDTTNAQVYTLTEGKDWVKTGETLPTKAEGTYKLDVLPRQSGRGWVFFAMDTSTGQLYELGYSSFTKWGPVGNPVK